MQVRLWAHWFQSPSDSDAIFCGDLEDCFREFPVTPSEEADARKSLVDLGHYYGGCGGEYQIRRVLDTTWKGPAVPPGSNLWGDVAHLCQRTWDRLVLGRKRAPHRLD